MDKIIEEDLPDSARDPEATRTYEKGVSELERMRFTDLDSYQRIWRWMGECGDTHQQAGEVIFSTPNMRWPGQVARPGDWIVRTAHGFVAEPAETQRPVAVHEWLSGRSWHLHGDTIYQPDWAGICYGCLS